MRTSKESHLFNPGDCVVLNSGGPKMTVLARSSDALRCIWFNEDGVVVTNTFPEVALSLLEARKVIKGSKPPRY